MKKVLFGGTFDLLHYGHILAIKKAKSYGDYLIVDVMSDERASFKKGNGRPIIPIEERIQIIKSLRDVDEVVSVKGNSVCSTLLIIPVIKPNVLVLSEKDHPDKDEIKQKCEEYGVEYVQMDRIVSESGLDTTNIIKKILEYGRR